AASLREVLRVRAPVPPFPSSLSHGLCLPHGNPSQSRSPPGPRLGPHDLRRGRAPHGGLLSLCPRQRRLERLPAGPSLRRAGLPLGRRGPRSRCSVRGGTRRRLWRPCFSPLLAKVAPSARRCRAPPPPRRPERHGAWRCAPSPLFGGRHLRR